MSKSEEKIPRWACAFWGAIVGILLSVVVGSNIASENRELAAKAIEGDKTESVDVADNIGIASLKDYASLEAKRTARMAAILMNVGGEYTANCRAVYNTGSENAATRYSIKLYKLGADKEGKDDIEQEWFGGSWAECIAKMMVWKQGGE